MPAQLPKRASRGRALRSDLIELDFDASGKLRATDSAGNDVDFLPASSASVPLTAIGAANGVAPLGSDLKVPAANLPSYVDDVLEFANLAALPATGETGKIYVAVNGAIPSNPSKQYRWSGSAYTEISPSPGSTDAIAEGATNLYFTPARAVSAGAGVYITSAAASAALASKADKGLLTAAGFTVSAAGRLLGRFTAGAGATNVEEVIIGTGLTMVGNELRATAAGGSDADVVQGLVPGLSSSDAAANAATLTAHIISRATASGANGFGLAIIPVGRWRIAWAPDLAAMKAAGCTAGFEIIGKSRKGSVLLHNYDENLMRIDNSSGASAPLAVSEVVIVNQVTAGGSGSVASRVHRLRIVGHTWRANDLIHLSTQIVKSFQPNARIGESFRVRYVETDYVYADGMLGYRDEYAAGGYTSMVARRLDKTFRADLYNFTVEPLTDANSLASDGNPASREFSIVYSAMCRSGFDRLTFFKSWGQGAIRLESCCDTFSGSAMEWLEGLNRPDVGSPLPAVLVSHLTYTIQMYGGCYNTLIQGGRSIGWRHAPTTDGRSSGPGSAPWYTTGDPFYFYVMNFHAIGSKGSPYDTHPEGGDGWYINCIAEQSHGADNAGGATYSGNDMQVRARRMTVVNLQGRGGNGGIEWNLWNHGPDDWLKIVNTRLGPYPFPSDTAIGIGVNENQILTTDRRRLILENVTVESAGRNLQLDSSTVDVEYWNYNSLRPFSGHVNIASTGATLTGTGMMWDSNSASLYGAQSQNRTLFGVRTVAGTTARLIGHAHRLGTDTTRHTPSLFEMVNITTKISDAGGTSLPASTIYVDTVKNFTTSGQFLVNGQTITYTNFAFDSAGGGPRFTGCTGGTGTLTAGQTVTRLNSLVSNVEICDRREIDRAGIGARPLVPSAQAANFNILSVAQGHVRGLGLADGTLLTASTIVDGQMVVRSGGALTSLPIPSGGGGSGGTVYGIAPPSQHGLLDFNFPPIAAGFTGTLVAGTGYAARVKFNDGGTLTGVRLICTTAGASLTSSYVNVYNLAGALLGTSGEVSAGFLSTGEKAVPLSAPITGLSAGAELIVAYVFAGTTAPRFAAGSQQVGIGYTGQNVTLGDAKLRNFFIFGTGLTALADPLPSPSVSSTSVTTWVGLY